MDRSRALSWFVFALWTYFLMRGAVAAALLFMGRGTPRVVWLPPIPLDSYVFNLTLYGAVGLLLWFRLGLRSPLYLLPVVALHEWAWNLEFNVFYPGYFVSNAAAYPIWFPYMLSLLALTAVSVWVFRRSFRPGWLALSLPAYAAVYALMGLPTVSVPAGVHTTSVLPELSYACAAMMTWFGLFHHGGKTNGKD